MPVSALFWAWYQPMKSIASAKFARRAVQFPVCD